MPQDLFIPACVQRPRHRLHPPDPRVPLRIRIQGPLVAIERVLPHTEWRKIGPFPQQGGVELARLAHAVLYDGQEVTAATRLGGCPVVRDEYLAWVMEGQRPFRRPLDYIDYYGVTFDHLVPPEDPDPEVLVINIIELECKEGTYADGPAFAKEVLQFAVDPADYVGKRVLAVPRCCQHKRGTQDRKLINESVNERERRDENGK